MLKPRAWCQSKLAMVRVFSGFFGKTKKTSAIIRSNRHYFLANIQPTYEFIRTLLRLNCIKQDESHFILRQQSTLDRNEKLLYFLRSFDETKFSNFVKCLCQTNQKAVARIVDNGGG